MFNRFKQKFPLLYNILYENYKGLTQNPRWLLMRKLAKFPWVLEIRKKFFVKNQLSNFSEFITDGNSTLFPDINIDTVVEHLKKDGLYLGINLPEEIVQEIVSFAYSYPCYAYHKPNLGFYYHQKELAEKHYGQKLILARYFNTALLCPAIKKLQNDPKLLAIAAKYLECKPVHQSNQLWWSFPGEMTKLQKMQTFQMFHYDLDDYRFLKFFFYLTNVDMYGGPHVCVKGSHRHKTLSYLVLAKCETDEKIINSYGTELLVNIYGKAGFGFVEDTFCFHKGTAPINQDRLMLQVEFATTDYGMQHDTRDPSLLQFLINRES